MIAEQQLPERLRTLAGCHMSKVGRALWRVLLASALVSVSVSCSGRTPSKTQPGCTHPTPGTCEGTDVPDGSAPDGAHPPLEDGGVSAIPDSSGSPVSSSEFTTFLANPAHTNFIEDAALVPPLRQLWRMSLGQPLSYPLVVGDFIYVTVAATDTLPTRLLTFDRLTGAPAWSANLGEATFGDLAYENGRVFEVDRGSNAMPGMTIRTFNATSGALEWQVPMDPTLMLDGQPPVAFGGTLYTTGFGTALTLFAHDEASGALKWSAASAGGLPAASAEGVFAFDACGNGTAINHDGSSKWKQGSEPCYPSGTAVLFEHTLYETLESASSDALVDTRTGKALGTFVSNTSPAFGHGIELTNDGDTLQATSLLSGTKAWTFTPEGDLLAPGFIVSGTVFVGSSLGTIYALDATTGKLAWSENTGSAFATLGQSHFGIAAAHGTLVVTAGEDLIAYGPASPQSDAPVRKYGGPDSCPWSFVHASVAPGAPDVRSMVVADFNNDNKLDLALASKGPFGGGGVNVRLGVGDGTFTALQEMWPFFSGASALASADLDADGMVDVVAAGADEGEGATNVRVMLNNGDGTFKKPTDYVVGRGPLDLALGDLDGQGGPDLVVGDGTGLRVLLSTGKGTFGTPVPYAIGEAKSLALGDLNNDGKADLVLGTVTPLAVQVLLGQGDGTFAAPLVTPVDGWPMSLALGDVDGNGKQDLIVATGEVTILSGQGDGTFAQPVILPAGSSVEGVALGDIDLDGFADLVVTNYLSASTRLFFGKGDGTFEGRVAFAVGTFPTLPAIADFNADGRPDVITCDVNAASLSVLLGACATAAH